MKMKINEYVVLKIYSPLSFKSPLCWIVYPHSQLNFLYIYLQYLHVSTSLQMEICLSIHMYITCIRNVGKGGDIFQFHSSFQSFQHLFELLQCWDRFHTPAHPYVLALTTSFIHSYLVSSTLFCAKSYNKRNLSIHLFNCKNMRNNFFWL